MISSGNQTWLAGKSLSSFNDFPTKTSLFLSLPEANFSHVNPISSTIPKFSQLSGMNHPKMVGLWHWVMTPCPRLAPGLAAPTTCAESRRAMAISWRRENWFPETDLDLGWWMLVEPKTSKNVRGNWMKLLQNGYEHGPCQRWWRVDVASEAIRTAAAQLNNGCHCWNFTEPASAIRSATVLFLHLPNWEEMTRLVILCSRSFWNLLLDLLPAHLRGSNNLGMLRGTS